MRHRSPRNSGFDNVSKKHKRMTILLICVLNAISLNRNVSAIGLIEVFTKTHAAFGQGFAISLGPVVQSIACLTSSLRGQLIKCFTTL